ncbi:MAG: hypothetical protein LUG99_01710 [Lachnospiraceae bacterium]|nr:hypothetical protein [Lachnospiraceae bacterium]
MYAVSDDFLETVAANARSYYWAGTITTTAGLVSILTSLASLDVICEDTEHADAYDDTRVESS